MDVNTLASKRVELIRNAAIVRKHKSTSVCLRVPVAARTRKRRNARCDLWTALLAIERRSRTCAFTFTFMRLWPGSIRREWPGSGAVRALDKK